MTDFIYSRVSTEDQSAEQQADHLLKEYPNAAVVKETFTGTTTDRPRFQKLLRDVVSGDRIIVLEVSRLGRNTVEVLEVVNDLKVRGVELVVKQLGSMDVTSAAGEMILTVMAGIAAMERSTMLERQRIGIERAKREGKYAGRKATDPALLKAAKSMLAGGATKDATAKHFNIGLSTLYRLLK